MLEEIRVGLEGFRDPIEGRRLMRTVTRSHEIYSGPLTERLPALFFFPEDGYGLTGGSGGHGQIVEHLSRAPALQGAHDGEGLLTLQGPHIRPQNLTGDLSIQDVTATTLYLLGLAIP
jgi:predicted AlkP superfamily phosphohydrolase/phosphomutase